MPKRDDRTPTQKMQEAYRALGHAFEEVRVENAEINQLFELQHKRMGAAVKLWRKARPDRDDVFPDLGSLLEWLLFENANQANRIKAFEQRSELYSKAFNKYLKEKKK